MLLQISGVFMFLEQSPLGSTNSQRYVSIFLYINAFFRFLHYDFCGHIRRQYELMIYSKVRIT